MVYLVAGLVVGEICTTRRGNRFVRFLYEITGVDRKHDRIFGVAKDTNGCIAFDMSLTGLEREIEKGSFALVTDYLGKRFMDRTGVIYFADRAKLKAFLALSDYRYSRKQNLTATLKVDTYGGLLDAISDAIWDSITDSEKLK